MKHKNHIFGWLSVPAFLLTVACSDNADMKVTDKNSFENKNRVILSLSTENGLAATRADESPFSHISDGTKANKLVYAVYRKNDKGEFEIVTDYINESVNGLNVIEETTFPLTLEFVMDVEDEFTVALWAQNNQCKAFDTKDLTKVKVDYSKVTNNYELADAFCNIAVVKGSDTGVKEVKLRRPLAQINVGDAGWDYEAAAILKPNPRTYAKSSITMSGLAQFYNVLEARTLTNDDLEDGEKAIYDGTVVFNMDYMPAFNNLTKYDSNFDWEDLSYLPYSKGFGPKDQEGNALYDEEIEEFLRLKLNDDDENFFRPYIGYDSELTVKENFDNNVTDTEIYKYLSMCYVLVPVSKDQDGKVQGGVINNVSFSVSDANGSITKNIFTINNVPAQQNWRTNIISDKLFMGDQKFKLFIVPTYAGEFNNASGNNSGDSKNDWNNVEMDFKLDKDNNKVWFVKTVDENGEELEYGDPNDEFLGYGDSEYKDWDKTQEGSSSTPDPDQSNQ
ncbi:MAG: hypothetical protein J1D77_05495 [Muribaculaceae bacterium]|nr:hypothetical protein [Muribaculaceae bacterium]